MKDGEIKVFQTELYRYTVIKKGDRIKFVEMVKK